MRRFTRRPATLRGRLALLALASTAIWVALLTAAFNVVLDARLRAQADDLLRTRAAAVAATVEVRSNGSLTVHEPSDDHVLDTGIWIYQGRRVVEGPPPPGGPQAWADRLAGGEGFADESSGSAPFRLYALPIRDRGRQVGTVVAAVEVTPYRHTAETALIGSIGLAVLLLGGVYPVTRAVVARALRPVGVMSRQAARWSGEDAGHRFGAERRPAELADLAGTLDALLDRLAAVLRHEQQLTGEMSHELRTPLAALTAEVEWLQARPRGVEEQETAHRAIASGAARMHGIVETLLTEARTRGSETSGRCSLRETIEEVARHSAEAHPQDPPVVVRTGIDGEQPTVGVSAPLLERILVPLLDNARRYAVRCVAIEYAAVPGRNVEVTVSDDGPGIPAGLWGAVFEPGFRADPASRHDGAGLGLPLARRLARAAGGEITVSPADTGARFVVSLPAG
ncbi:HAMP domain-containing histidine kinase [Streptomyces sp. So13.3]|uniref:sensor histidine kinase n=1 Tax=Streptomyces TaxID=1883 RepID=UPI0011064988|nr:MULTISPECIES: HAMP domain-containing sensor histidine kinase [Streptomyces]MCZ4101636.1 HAMP domain-containing sensor histidine kinase [Streptomyces sp. H39-C1]QNA76427.1 HAMP domain-containing histidine kinase [Streptomyces sp. So13.3]